jgi:hypothetical protein
MPACLIRVCDSSCSAKEHEFFVKFSVLAYFRVPKFRCGLFPKIENTNLVHKFYEFVFLNEKGEQLKKELEALHLELPKNDLLFFLYPFIV